MTNHPNRSRQSVDAAIRRLLTRHRLLNITMTIDVMGVYARAYPDPYGPLVTARREIALGGGDYSLAEAASIRDKLLLPVAYAIGKTAELAVAALAAELEAGRDANPAKARAAA